MVKDSVVDVVVVGAGIAGLHIASELATLGKTFVVLEARKRVGGRLLSNEDGLDLGATWFWPNEPRVNRLVDQLNLETFDQYSDGDALYHTSSGSERLPGNPIDVPSSRILNGAQELVTGIANRLPPDSVMCDRAVTEVVHEDQAIAAITEVGRVVGRHLVLAVPPALATASINFSPSLPEDLMTVARSTPVWMGGTAKIVARYPHAFWREDGLAGSAISHIGPLREIHDMSGPKGQPAALFGFAPNSRSKPDATQILDQLQQLFGPEAANPLNLWIQDWASEPYTSPPFVHDLTNFDTFGHQLYQQTYMGGRLLWSPTETASQFAGHIEGALAAAERTVRLLSTPTLT